MDGYPAGSLDHNVPFLVVSGLKPKVPGPGQDEEEPLAQGLLLKSELPLLESAEAVVLEQYFDQIDAQGLSWLAVSREDLYRFRIKSAGRSFLLPPRKASLATFSQSFDSTPILHSPFSPLSSVSPLYPDGLMDSLWLTKHQDLVPSIYASFYTLGNDDQIRADINLLKETLAQSGYKTRFAAVFVGRREDGIVASQADRVQARLENIRRATALDSKSIFYIPPQDTPDDLKRIVDGILSVLHGVALDYYRDLGRHAKKKRSRGLAPQPTVPPTSGTSRTLSLSDWNFRYDFKAAALAEFRHETDVALRSYEQAYDLLLGQDVMDMMPSWSPRWNEARLLSDIISIRCLRIHLWMGQTTLAVRRWQSHRDRIGGLVDRRGHGTNNYGWAAWEARWAMVMANVMERVGVSSLAPAKMTLFIPPEKALSAGRLMPWELLHHTGYWYRMAARHLATRRALALQIPDEDRRPPSALPTSQTATKAHAYDLYMCPAPHQESAPNGQGVNHAQLIIDCLMSARKQFESRNQARAVAELSLDCARELASLGSWDEAMALLDPLWSSACFRSEGWLDLAEDFCWLTRGVAAETGRADLVVAIDCEMMNKKYTRRPDWSYDFARCLDGMETSSKPVVALSDDVVPSFITASFAFRNKESRAGESCLAQLVLHSDAMPASTPVVFSSLRIDFEGGLGPVIIAHDASASTKAAEAEDGHAAVPLEEDVSPGSAEEPTSSELQGLCDLTCRPGGRRVLEMAIPLRQAGEIRASKAVLSYQSVAFDLDLNLCFHEVDGRAGWYTRGAKTSRQSRPDLRCLHVEPRPPKMEIRLVEPLEQYYTDERVELQVEVRNCEDEAASVRLDVHLLGKELPPMTVLVGNSQTERAPGSRDESQITAIRLGRIGSGSSARLTVRIEATKDLATYSLHLRARYHLDSDAATSIVQELAAQINVVSPFEANYDLLPRLHPDPWPSLFADEGLEEAAEEDPAAVQAHGLTQQWSLQCQYASFASEELVITGIEMGVVGCAGKALYRVVEQTDLPRTGMVVEPKQIHQAQFDFIVQKLRLDDRQPVTLELAFYIRWKRRSGPTDSPANTTTMSVGQYLVLSTEPRVLASALHARRGDWPGLMHLDITIENPSSHLLTFGLTMDPSDAFAFSGPKQTTLHLLPLSRRVVKYRLLPAERGVYVRPGLMVRDKYFQKVLRIMPTDGMKMDKDGLLIWAPGEVSPGEHVGDVAQGDEG